MDVMSVLEYANDINRTVAEVLNKCEELGISARVEDDMLSQDDVDLLDNAEFDMDEIVEEIIENKNIKVDDSISKQKLITCFLEIRCRASGKRVPKISQWIRKQLHSHKKKGFVNA